MVVAHSEGNKEVGPKKINDKFHHRQRICHFLTKFPQFFCLLFFAHLVLSIVGPSVDIKLLVHDMYRSKQTGDPNKHHS